jgi:hypothetical protein
VLGVGRVMSKRPERGTIAGEICECDRATRTCVGSAGAVIALPRRQGGAHSLVHKYRRIKASGHKVPGFWTRM